MNIADQAKASLRSSREEVQINEAAMKLKAIADKFDVKKAKVDTMKQKQSVIIRRKLEDIQLVKDLDISLADL